MQGVHTHLHASPVKTALESGAALYMLWGWIASGESSALCCADVGYTMPSQVEKYGHNFYAFFGRHVLPLGYQLRSANAGSRQAVERM
jgi:hypothetical protein